MLGWFLIGWQAAGVCMPDEACFPELKLEDMQWLIANLTRCACEVVQKLVTI